jgi:hypothetical protein
MRLPGPKNPENWQNLHRVAKLGLVMNVLKDHRSAIYQTAASIFGSLLGFVIAALSLVIGFSGSPSLKLVRESSHYPTLWKTFAAANRALGLATVMSFLALIFDRDHCPSRLIFFAVVYAALLAALRVGRSVWILEQVVRLVAGKNPTS